MGESAKPRDGHPFHGPSVAVTTVLRLGAVASLCGGVLAAILVLVAGQRNGPMGLDHIFAAVGFLVLGMLAGGALWAGGSLVCRRSRGGLLEGGTDHDRLVRLETSMLHGRGAEEYHRRISDVPDGLSFEPTPVAPQAVPLASVGQANSRDDSQVLQAILDQLKELNENILMTDQQRRAKAQLRCDRLRSSVIDDIQAALDGADFARADRGLEMLADKIPDDEQIEPLRKQLHDARQAACDEEVQAVTRRAGDLMATGAFDQAEAEVLDMTQRYPDEPAAASLLDRVRREGRLFNEERQERMYGEVVGLAEARQWRQALGAAKRYVQAFPTGTGPDTVRAMLATIKDNARIEEVRELRDRIRDLIERRRYAEAVEYAHDVIKRFPDTLAAEELGRQMNRLRELARSSSSNGS